MATRYSATTLSHLVLAEGVPLVDAIAAVGQHEEAQRQTEDAAIVSAKALSFACLGGGLALFAASAIPLAGMAIVAGSLGLACVGPMAKPANHLSRKGERYLLQASELRHWLVMAWQAGYPIGQILSAYDGYCEAIGRELQFKRPQLGEGGCDFVGKLNISPDAISGLPPVTKIGDAPSLKPHPLNPSKNVKSEDESMPLPDNAIPLAPPEVIARYHARLAEQQRKQQQPESPKPNPIEETRAYAERQVTELNRQEAVATVVREKNSKIEAFDLINDVATASGEPWPKSIMWLGPSRSGKSWAMAASLQESVNHWESLGQSVGVWWISGKHDPTENDYAHGRGYQACSEVQVDELDRDELEDIFGDWYNLLNEFKMAKHFDKRFFVFDEMNLAASLCTPNPKTGFQPGPMASKFWQSLISQAISCPSNGRGQGKALWVASQMSSMQSLGLSTAQCGVFHEQIIFLSPTDSRSQFEKGALKNGFISMYLDPYQVKKGETGRFYHYQGRWRGLPVINMPEKSF